jgi:hypothetical protein
MPYTYGKATRTFTVTDPITGSSVTLKLNLSSVSWV